MKKITALAIAIVLSFSAFGQTFTENFNDGSFTDGPVWGGNPGIYIVNAASELQLMDIAGGTSYLSTPVSTADATTWEFYFRMEFAPSTSNQLRVYLNADQPDLSGALNAYFLQIGASGSTDALEFRRQDGTSSALLLSGTTGSVASDPAEARVRIIRDNAGNWELLADYTGGTNFVSEGTTTDATYTTGEHFGFHCEYTATRKDLFYFDDVSIDPIFVDMTPPEITEVIIVNSTALDVRFDEAVTSATANLPGNYSLTGIGNPGAANLDGADPTLVHLTGFPSAMQNGQSYTLSAINVEDINGNPANDSYTFDYILAETAEPFDLLINEFLADETPVIGLPETEYIELYNPSNKFIQLASLEFSDDSGSSYVTLPTYIIEPGAYLILTDDAANFPSIPALSQSISLTNGGDGILLRRASDLIEIHSKIYDASEIAGGISLELVNPTLTCAGASNWILSTNPSGGTPGAQNSEFDDTPDTDAPQLTDATVLNATEVLLTFDEIIDINNAVFTGVSGISNPQLQADGRSVILTVSTLSTGLTYTITATGAEDCYGNAGSSSAEFTYFLVEIAEPYDVLINEFMADGDPALGNIPTPDYIELWNNSSKNIDLASLQISDDSGGGFDALPVFTLSPNAYILVVGSGNSGLFAGFGDVVELPASLSLNSSTPDGIVLRRILDSRQIHAKLYSGAEVEESKSLELVNPNQPCAAIWMVSEDASGGTPGRENSNLDLTADEALPDLICANFIPPSSVQLIFNKALEAATANDIANYTVESIGMPSLATLEAPGNNTVLLDFNATFNADQIYQLTVDNVYDCTGDNQIGMMNTTTFANSEIEIGDIIINEILFAPDADGFDFVELYNHSNKILNLNGLFIQEKDEDGITDEGIIEAQCPLLPNQYLALTENPQNIIQNYPATPNPAGIVAMDLPNFLSDGGIVSLTKTGSFGSEDIDEFTFSDDFHNPLLDNTKGFSLERIDFDSPTEDPNNWESAAQDVRATPGYVNSQTNPLVTEDGSITIEDEVFSPDGDGYEDFLQIGYELDEIGYVANVRIYDARGRQIKSLANNQLLSPRGFFRWNGDLDNGEKARVGLYVVWVELFDTNGKVNYYKKTCVVAGNLGG